MRVRCLRPVGCSLGVAAAVLGGWSGCRAQDDALALELRELRALLVAQQGRPPETEASGMDTPSNLPAGLMDIHAESPEAAVAEFQRRVREDAALREEVFAAAGVNVAAEPSTVAVRLPSAAHALQNTVWSRRSEDGRAWQTLVFGETYVAVAEGDDGFVAQSADFGGAHPACLGQGMCVVTVEQRTLTTQHFAVQDDRLYVVDCVDYALRGEGEPPTASQLAQNGGLHLVAREGSVLCVRPLLETGYQRAPVARAGRQ